MATYTAALSAYRLVLLAYIFVLSGYELVQAASVAVLEIMYIVFKVYNQINKR